MILHGIVRNRLQLRTTVYFQVFSFCFILVAATVDSMVSEFGPKWLFITSNPIGPIRDTIKLTVAHGMKENNAESEPFSWAGDDSVDPHVKSLNSPFKYLWAWLKN